MKILHTADWHLGKRLESFNRHDEQVAVLEEICAIADKEDVDAVIIAGDLFDSYNPPAESEDLFYRICKKLTHNGLRPVIAIAGNHDAPERIAAPAVLARTNAVFYIGFPLTTIREGEIEKGLKIIRSDIDFTEFQLPRLSYPLRLFTTPFVNEYRIKEYLGTDKAENLRQFLTEKWAETAQKYADTEGVNIAMAHLYVMSKDQPPPEEPEEERSILQVGGASAIFTENIPHNWQYMAMGHLHRRQTIANTPCPIVYCGSPLAYSFSEADQSKYVLIIEAEPAKAVTVRPIELTQGKKLLRGEFDSVDAALQWLEANPNTYIDLTMHTETYLKGEDHRRLRQAHAGIVTINLKSTNEDDLKANKTQYVDLQRNIDDIFIDFFKYKKGTLPNDRLVKLFKEVLKVEI